MTRALEADRSWLWLTLLCGGIAAGLLIYSQTSAFTWDEGFHLLTAQLIQGGKQPYLDFCFPQTPLNAYWNAAWLALTNGGWRITHAVAALLSAGTAMLAAQFVFMRFPKTDWRLPGSVAVALMTGMHVLVMQFGTIAQAYAICLFLTVAAFRMACVAVERRGVAWSAAAGLLASAAAASSLLSAPAAPVLWLWIIWYDQTQSRVRKAIAFALGCVIPFLPVLKLFLAGSRQVLFNLFQYHLEFRRVHWEGATHNDIDVLTSWIESPQAWLIGCLAIAGPFSLRRSDWSRQQKAPYFLCAWLCLALALEQSTAHPTFSRYFVLLIPFAAILASSGLYFLAARVAAQARHVIMAVALVMASGSARALIDETGDFHWPQLEKIAARVEEVTPRNASLWSDEQIYFLTHRAPPPGMEFAFGHKLTLPPADAKLFHLVPISEIQQQLLDKRYATTVSCEEDDGIQRLQLNRIYAMKTAFPECAVFYQVR